MTTTEQPTISSSAYGEGLADVYDEMYPPSIDADTAGKFLAELAGPEGSVLELGVGTGRVASRTAAHGARVHGIDASPSMLEMLHARHGDSGITTEVLDFTEQSTGRTFDVVTNPLSTLFVGLTQAHQIRTLELMREQLRPGGTVVIEAFEPGGYHRMTEPKTETRPLTDGSLMIDTTFVNSVAQIIVVNHVTVGENRYDTAREVVRYAFPSEIDLMARLAGLQLVGRYGDWSRGPFAADSARHVSLYQTVADQDHTDS